MHILHHKTSWNMKSIVLLSNVLPDASNPSSKLILPCSQWDPNYKEHISTHICENPHNIRHKNVERRPVKIPFKQHIINTQHIKIVYRRLKHGLSANGMVIHSNWNIWSHISLFDSRVMIMKSHGILVARRMLLRFTAQMGKARGNGGEIS